MEMTKMYKIIYKDKFLIKILRFWSRKSRVGGGCGLRAPGER